ncbi:MAG: lipoyl(octanoyl) transferase LipB [Deltaproteobacteria bacterium]|nr:lipoyl(octanoyl) transferase LipB [Deltaproteobacteria bacterium]
MSKSNRCLCVDLQTLEYGKAWDLQTSLVDARKKSIVDRDVILLLEHPSVFTLGRRGGLDDLTVPRDVLEKSGIQVFHVERGGVITFHGPGQLIMYPIIDLNAARMRVVDYVEKLEEVMIRTVADSGIIAERNSLNRGIWVGNKKLGSIGIAIRKGICFHGMSLNVNISMKHFGWMNPCGLKQVEISSMQRELSHKVLMSKVCGAIKKHVESVFGINLIKTGLPELLKKLNKSYDSESNIKKTFKKTRLAETESAIRSHI